jgi:hypothetical protein
MTALLAAACPKNKEGTTEARPPVETEDKTLKVMKLRVVDLSESGSPFKNLAPPFEKLLLDPASENPTQTGAQGGGELVIELSNFCLPSQCFIGARSTLALRETSGLFQRFERRQQEPVEGLIFQPALERLAPRVHRSLRMWLRGLAASPETIRAWLRSSDQEKRRAGLQAMLDRDMAALTDALTPLLEDEKRENQEIAIALACAYKFKEHVPVLKKVALSGSITPAWSALQCLRFYPPQQANSSIIEVGELASLQRIKEEARKIIKSRRLAVSKVLKNGSSEPPISDTKDP